MAQVYRARGEYYILSHPGLHLYPGRTVRRLGDSEEIPVHRTNLISSICQGENPENNERNAVTCEETFSSYKT